MQTIDPQYFIDKAEQCFRLAKSVREYPTYREAATELDALGNEFLKKAVELDTDRDRAVTRPQH
jgi:hypothetical protein